ncbi:MAG: NAD(P)H-hydrate dehydratase [Opitutales bacterium]
MSLAGSHPILSAAETLAMEEKRFGGQEAAEWRAMQAAGQAVAAAVAGDFTERGDFPTEGRILVVAGKGHNGGDALLAATQLLETHPRAHADVLLASGARAMRPLALRAWQKLQHAHRDRVRAVTLRSLGESYAVSLDGLFGFQYRPPLDARSLEILRRINALAVGLRAAVDLPSGLGAPEAFRADFTYATGVVKRALLDLPNAGRLRYLDLGFLADEAMAAVTDRVLTARVLDPLRAWRDPRADKRGQGNLFVVAGSRHYPGAALMTVLAALRSGAGLVTAFVPESLVPAFAAQVPEAIWVGWPETPEGGLALEGRYLLQERLPRATALVIGPGLGREAETLTLAADIVRSVPVPVLVDADALQAPVVAVARAPLVLTPHAGEFARIAGARDVRAYATATKAIVVLKGPVTRIGAGNEQYHSFFGGPVLARGGSGDLLAGIVGTQLAQTPSEPLAAACRGVAWHGLAADALARAHGATAVRTTQVLDFLGEVLRE